MNRRTLKSEKLQSSSPSRKSALRILNSAGKYSKKCIFGPCQYFLRILKGVWGRARGKNFSVFSRNVGAWGSESPYHCHHKHHRPEKILRELFPAILDRIITGKFSKRINLIVIRAHYRKHLGVHRSHDTRTEIP